MTTTPTARTLTECRSRGWPVDVVERWIPKTNLRSDLFGVMDMVALDGKPGVLGIQTTTTDNMSSRVAKITASDDAKAWLRAGNRIAVWGWAKRGAVGKRKVWTLKETDMGYIVGKEDVA